MMDGPTPILIVSDAPDQYSGLARVTRDIAMTLVSQLEWRVATLGWLARGSSRLPWTQYTMSPGTFGERNLAGVWDEFSDGKPGVVFTIWDLHRILWLARPEFIEDAELQADIRRIRKVTRLWSYVPMDATGVGDRLTGMAREALLGIDRILCYTLWSMEVVTRTIGHDEASRRGLDWMPHTFNERTFHP